MLSRIKNATRSISSISMMLWQCWPSTHSLCPWYGVVLWAVLCFREEFAFSIAAANLLTTLWWAELCNWVFARLSVALRNRFSSRRKWCLLQHSNLYPPKYDSLICSAASGRHDVWRAWPISAFVYRINWFYVFSEEPPSMSRMLPIIVVYRAYGIKDILLMLQHPMPQRCVLWWSRLSLLVEWRWCVVGQSVGCYMLLPLWIKLATGSRVPIGHQ